MLPDDDAEAKRALAERRATGMLVLPGLLGTPFAGWSKAKTALDEAIVDARIKAAAAATSPTLIVPWSIHDLRRTVATGLQRLGVRLEVTEAVLNQISASRAGIAGVYQRGAGGCPQRRDAGAGGLEAKKALTVAPAEVRHHASWYLWRWVGEAEGEPAGKAERWRTKLGPFFNDIWPLDARLRDEHTSQNFMLMTLDSADAFPLVVDAVCDLLVPDQLYLIAHSLRLEQAHENLLRRHPLSFLKLANALIDPRRYPAPSDLGQFLLACAEADPGCINDPSYVRLFGLSRQQAA